jgi:hypothetical protein
MKTRQLFAILLIAVLPATLNAQPFQTGDKVITASLGIGSTLYTGTGYTGTVPPLSFTFEYALQEMGPGILGLGAYFGISSYKYEASVLGSTYGWKYSNTIIGARGNYHYNFHEKIDTYAGLLLGYNIVSSKATGDWPGGVTGSATGSGVAWSLYIGGRYFFTDNIAAMVELGYGIAWLNIGVAFKF